jgi:hypothetical protein
MKTINVEWRLDLAYAVFGLCCTWCQLKIMTWRDGDECLGFVFSDGVRVGDMKETDGDKDGTDV